MERIIQRVNFYNPPKLELKRVAAYARVSSAKDSMLHSLSAQVSYYSEYIQSHRDWVYCGVYADEGLTGTKDNRTEYQRMLNDCRNGKIDMIITKSISRFARNTVTLLETMRELKAIGIDIYFEEQRIHTISSDGELLLTILASYAQEESRSASENQKWRIRKGFQEGELVNLRFIFGYTINNGEVTINEYEAPIVREIFHRVIEGEPLGTIARDLNKREVCRPLGGVWTSNRIRELVSNEKYTGNALLQKTFLNNHIDKKQCSNNGELPRYYAQSTHEAIIDEETFLQAQAVLGKIGQTHKHNSPVRYMLTGMIRCGTCGKNFKRTTNNGKVFWACPTYINNGKSACPAKRIPDNSMTQTILEVLNSDSIDEDEFKRKVELIQANDPNMLTFHFHDGKTQIVTWNAPSRRESWTQEMKERARQRALDYLGKQ